tara:strand:+ start:340 stop:1353 length:1014 start_codon:yes stop_codon:yes gene_type:complete
MNNLNVYNKKILVTGGAGFIGSNLCKILLSYGNKVICLDNLSTGYYSNIECFLKDKNFTFVNGDICDFSACEKAVFDVDYVLHQAALGSVPRSIKDPISTTNVNILGFVNIFHAAVKAKVRRFIYAASSSTYGDSIDLPKIENKIGKPLSPYAITKYTNELYAENFSKIYHLEVVGLRYFNVFGENQSPNGAYAAVIPKFVNDFINHRSPIINGDGSFSRDFTYIDNVIQANLLSINTKSTELFDKENMHQVFNVAYGDSTSLNRLVDILKNNLLEFDKSIESIIPIYGPSRDGDIPHSLASIDKAKKMLGYNPKYDIESGIKATCKWYFKRLKIKN